MAINKTARIDAGDGYEGEWFDVRGITMRDSDAAQKAADDVNAGAEGKTALLARIITDWSFTDEKGAKLPITPANLADMDVAAYAPVLEHIKAKSPKA